MTGIEKAMVHALSNAMLLLATGVERGKGDRWARHETDILMSALEVDRLRHDISFERAGYLWQVARRYGAMRCSWHGRPARGVGL